MELRHILKELRKTPKGKAKILDVLKRRRNKLGENPFWILEYTYYEELSRNNVMKKLFYSRSDYYNKLNNALERLDALIDDTTHRELVNMI